jgi:hypothetical protein
MVVPTGDTIPFSFNYRIDDNPDVINVKDKETVDRIVETVVNESTWNVNISDNGYFNNYYTGILDFIKHPHTTLIKGEHALYRWMQSKNIHDFKDKIYIPRDVIKIDDGYYFKHHAMNLYEAIKGNNNKQDNLTDHILYYLLL